MNKILAALVLLVLVAGGAYAAVYVSRQEAPSTSVSSDANDSGIRAMLEEFGRRLKNVALLAPDAAAQIEAQYSAYVAPQLLAEWKADPSQALGRQTSSPWPDSLYVVDVVKEGGSYRAEANIVETTSDGPAGVQPVTFTLTMTGDMWLISNVTKGSYSALPQRSTTVGYWECLPHKDQTGPQTMECAFGIAVDQSDGHYAIDTRLMSTYPVDFPTGTKVKVDGIITPANQLSSIQKYDIDGIISATSITKI